MEKGGSLIRPFFMGERAENEGLLGPTSKITLPK